jgi:hypothetical protein
VTTSMHYSNEQLLISLCLAPAVAADTSADPSLDTKEINTAVTGASSEYGDHAAEVTLRMHHQVIGLSLTGSQIMSSPPLTAQS